MLHFHCKQPRLSSSIRVYFVLFLARSSLIRQKALAQTSQSEEWRVLVVERVEVHVNSDEIYVSHIEQAIENNL